jgi:hypothetical protein
MRATLIILALLFPFSAYAGLNNGLVGYWPLDKRDTPWTSATAATTKDRSGNGNTGTLTNMSQATSPVTGKIGQALKFDGVDDYIDAGTSSSVKPSFPFSVSTWIMLPDGVSSMNISTSAAPNGEYSGYTVGIASGFINAQIGNNTGTCAPSFRNAFVTTATTLNTGRWYHITAVFTNTTSFSIFVNGSSVAVTQSGNNGINIGYAAGAHLNIGRFYGGCAGSYAYNKAVVDEVRIYNRALSAGEITQLYKQGASKYATSPTTSLTSGLVGYWTLDGKDTPWTSATAATTKDRSGNSNTGTLTNMYQATSTVAGKLGQGLSFDGVDDYIDAGASSSLKPSFPFSVSFWVKRAASGDAARITTGDTGGSGVYSGYMVYAQSDLSVQIGDNGADCAPGSRYTMVSSTAPVGIGGWYHVVVVFSGVHSFSAFVNGASVALSYSGGSANSMVYGAGSRLRMNSSYACGTTIREKGSIDEVRIYNRALSATEITQLYKQGASKFATSPTTSLTSGLVGYWTLDGKDTPWTSATAATTKDRSSNSNTGTLTNMSQATSTVIGKIGQGLTCNGTSQYVLLSKAVPAVSSGGAMSASLWMKGTDSYGGLFSLRSSVSSSPIFDISVGYDGSVDTSGKIRAITRYDSNLGLLSIGGTKSVNDGLWHHIVLVLDQANNYFRIYVDGVQTDNGTQSVDGAITTTANQSSMCAEKNWIDTSYTTAGNRYYAGNVDEVRVYNRALSATEITQLYKQGLSTSR